MPKRRKVKRVAPLPAMKLYQKALAFVISLAISVITMFIVEQTRYAEKVVNFYTGGATDMAQLRTVAATNYIRSIEIIGFIFFIFLVAYGLLFVIVFEMLGVIYLLVSSRWRKPAVFISYKYSEKTDGVNTNKIALEIKGALEKKGFRIRHFEYNREMHHDEVNAEIKKRLSSAHALVAIPDPYDPSYVNAEILCAFYTEKPIFIIKHTKDQRLPDTANTGHTVLLLNKLKQQKYEPLSKILEYIHKTLPTRDFLLIKPLESFLAPLFELEDALFKTVIIAGVLIAILIAVQAPVITVLTLLKVAVVLFGIFAAYVTIEEIYRRLRLRKVVKQLMINAGNTYDYFEEAGFDEKLLGCIDEVGLRTGSASHTDNLVNLK